MKRSRSSGPARAPRSRALDRYVRRAGDLGALGAKLIGPEDVFTAEWVRFKCQYGCDGYGKCLTCPPRSPSPDRTRAMLDGFRSLLLIRGARWTAVTAAAVTLEREMFLDGHHRAFAFGAGPCELCPECALEAGCRHPDRARPAMEASGIDVFSTARAAGFPIEVVRTRGDAQHYYALVAIE